jgi:hypothetical protein
VQTPQLVKNAFKHGQKRPIPFIRDLVLAIFAPVKNLGHLEGLKENN